MFNRKPDAKRPEIGFMPAREPLADHRHMSPPAIPLAAAVHQDYSTASEEADSVIGSDLSIEGQSISIRCAGLLRINGSISADLHSRRLIVGQSGQVQGSINAEEVNIYGRVGGAINGGRVVLHSTAHVEGDIHSRSLSIEDGASFDGRSRKITEAETTKSQANDRQGHAQIITPPRMHA